MRGRDISTSAGDGAERGTWTWARCQCKYVIRLGSEERGTHCARRPSCETVTMILSAKLMLVTSVGMPLTSPFAWRHRAGKGSSLTSVDAMVCGQPRDETLKRESVCRDVGAVKTRNRA